MLSNGKGGKLGSMFKLFNKLNSIWFFCCVYSITFKSRANFIIDLIIAFDEGRTLPNLLGCLLSRRFPVHASES